MSEFDIIQTYFNWPQNDAAIIVPNGDDAAVIELAPHEELVVSVDTSIRGVHFPEETPPHAIGYKSLAVNLSDIAAMGAKPRWFTLALSLPAMDTEWLEGFSAGLRILAEKHDVALIGGDTTRGPLSITIQIMGTVAKGTALRRNGARHGDLIGITGTPGDAAAGLAITQGQLHLPTAEQDYCIKRLNYPTPQTTFGIKLNGHAHSCIDVSDGILADLQHILDQSNKGACLYDDKIPFSHALKNLPEQQKMPLALTGGDDYELLFTLAPEKLATIRAIAIEAQVKISVIGEVNDHDSSQLVSTNTVKSGHGFNHFAS